ncbi:MAG: hypothetical protein NT023_21025 [Armatimonadetes bacterium]|nr:hypothetical protein [Armatimonadota bacterium]
MSARQARRHPSKAFRVNRLGMLLLDRGIGCTFNSYFKITSERFKATLYILHHSFGTHPVVQELLGHTQLVTTQVYAHVIP